MSTFSEEGHLQIHPDRIEAGDGHERRRSLNALACGAVPRYDRARHGRAHEERAFKSTILTQCRDFALGHSGQRQQLRAFLENGARLDRLSACHEQPALGNDPFLEELLIAPQLLNRKISRRRRRGGKHAALRPARRTLVVRWDRLP